MAATRVWDGGGTTDDWFNSANWNPNGSPASSDTLGVGLGGTPFADSLVQAGSGGQIGFSGSTATGEFRAGLEIGRSGTGSLGLESGASIKSSYGAIGVLTSSTGTVVLWDSDTAWVIPVDPRDFGNLTVGDAGHATLEIRDEALVDLNRGSVFVASQGGSTGSVLVKDRADLEASGSMYVGGGSAAAGGTGTLTVDDADVRIGSTLRVWGGGSVSMVANDPYLFCTLTADAVTLSPGATFTVGEQCTLIANSLSGFGNAPSFTGNLTIGHAGGSGSGNFAVGAGQHLVVGEWLHVGYGAPGTLALSGGGDVDANSIYPGRLGGDGTITVDGLGSTLRATGTTWIGSGGRGTISITDRGRLETHHLDLSHSGATKSMLTVDGDGTTLSATGELYLFDQSEVHIQNNADATCWRLFDGHSGAATDAKVVVNGFGSTLTLTDTDYPCLIGVHEGKGTLTIENGGLVSTLKAVLGGDPTTQGSATVTGGGSRWTITDWLRVGSGSTGNLTVENLGRVTADRVMVGMLPGSSGTVSLKATLDVSGAVYVGGYDTAAGGTATVTLGAASQLDVDDTLLIWGAGVVECQGGVHTIETIDHTHGGTFSFTGGTLHVRQFNGLLVNNGGMLEPGTSVGTTTASNYTQNSGVLRIEIAGAASYDTLHVIGQAKLGGSLVVDLLGTYVPGAANTFTIVTGAPVNGTFANAPTYVYTVDGGRFRVVYTGTSVQLRDYEGGGTYGDYDNDGDSDLGDFAHFIACFNGPARPPAGPDCSDTDADHDGDVDLSDFSVFLTCFNGPKRPPAC